MQPTTCEACGETLTGERHQWPFCPHGDLEQPVMMIDDGLPGGPRWMHNLDSQPIWVETKTQLRDELSSRGLVLADRKHYNRDDRSPYATKGRLRAGQRDPFLHRAPKRR